MRTQRLCLLLPLLLCLPMALGGCGVSNQQGTIQLSPQEVKLGITAASVGYALAAGQVKSQHDAGKLTGAEYAGAEAGLAALQTFIQSATTANNAGQPMDANTFLDSFNSALNTFITDYISTIVPPPTTTTQPTTSP